MNGRKRPNDFHLRLSNEEYAELHEKAARVGIGPQAYIHAVLQGKELREMPSMDLIDTLRALSQIKNSLFMIASSATNASEEEKASYWENVAMLDSTIRQLLVFMYGE